MTEEVTDVTDAVEANPAKDRKSMPKGRVIVFGKWCKECGLCVCQGFTLRREPAQDIERNRRCTVAQPIESEDFRRFKQGFVEPNPLPRYRQFDDS